MRAYSQSASQALSSIETRECFIRQRVQVELPYDRLDTLEHWLRGTDILVAERSFDTSVHLSLLVPVGDVRVLQEKLHLLGAVSTIETD